MVPPLRTREKAIDRQTETYIETGIGGRGERGGGGRERKGDLDGAAVGDDALALLGPAGLVVVRQRHRLPPSSRRGGWVGGWVGWGWGERMRRHRRKREEKGREEKLSRRERKRTELKREGMGPAAAAALPSLTRPLDSALFLSFSRSFSSL
jgi:hypothetical protein